MLIGWWTNALKSVPLRGSGVQLIGPRVPDSTMSSGARNLWLIGRRVRLCWRSSRTHQALRRGVRHRRADPRHPRHPEPAVLWTDAALGRLGRCLIYDRRSFGRSERPEPFVTSDLDDQVRDAAALLKAYQATPAVVID